MFELSTAATEAILAAVVAAGIFIGGMVLQGKIDAGKYEALQLSYAQAQAKAVAQQQAMQATIDQQASTADAAETKEQQTLSEIAQQAQAGVKVHVVTKTITATCVPYGFVRVLYAASHGVAADSITLPTGATDGSCSPIGWTDLASAIIHDYGQSRANSEQLDALNALLAKENLTLKAPVK